MKPTFSPLATTRGRLLALSKLGLASTTPGCSSGEGSIELKRPPTVTASTETPQRGPARAANRQKPPSMLP